MMYDTFSSFNIKSQLDSSTPIILPLGAIEAHGAHLPLNTDNILAEKYVSHLAREIDCLLLPVLPYGQVWSLRNFPGSLSLETQTLTSILIEIGKGIYRQGGRLLILFTAHLGNMVAMKTAARRLYERHPDFKVLHMFYPNIKTYADEIREGFKSHHSFIHADEIETSLMLYLSPGDVDMTKAVSEAPIISEIGDYTPTYWETFTDTAVLGDARLASKEKGEYLVKETISDFVDIIKKIQKEQEYN